MKKTMNLFKRALFFLKKKITIYGIIALGIIVVFLVFSIVKNGNGKEKTIIVQRSNFVQQVSVSGKVVPAENVELSFKNSGRIDRIYFSVDELAKTGEIVKAGALIAQIDAKDAIKNVRDAEVNLASAKLSLEKINIENSSENTNYDLKKAYDDGFTSVSDAFLDLPTVVTGLESLFSESALSDNVANIVGKTARSYKNSAEDLYYEAEDVFSDTRADFRLLNRNSNTEDIENIINETYDIAKLINDAVKSTTNFVDYLADDSNTPSDYDFFKDTLSDYADIMNGHVSSLLSSKTDIKDSKDTFSTSDLDIKDAQLEVQEKQNALQDAKNQLADYYIRAPFDGIITKIDAKVGEMASSNMPLVSMMSAGTYQIESYVPEVNISKIKIGDKALISLDAYGEEIQFDAVVVSIDPAETIKDGVSTYKIKLQFTKIDERIKSGMTANVMIIVFEKPDTIVISKSSVFENNGKKFVQIKRDQEIIDREVITGEESVLGQVEIISGLIEGDVVIFNPKI